MISIPICSLPRTITFVHFIFAYCVFAYPSPITVSHNKTFEQCDSCFNIMRREDGSWTRISILRLLILARSDNHLTFPGKGRSKNKTKNSTRHDLQQAHTPPRRRSRCPHCHDPGRWWTRYPVLVPVLGQPGQDRAHLPPDGWQLGRRLLWHRFDGQVLGLSETVQRSRETPLLVLKRKEQSFSSPHCQVFLSTISHIVHTFVGIALLDLLEFM
ncbi:MAG: hypothetical protein BYD32DRAFT_249178 [Podila humilis]|nr:MAG: hypothetical protein BYD32DRAFT_249178 [Podila humilis]